MIISENEDCTFDEKKSKEYSDYVYFIDKLVKKAELINIHRTFPILGICLGFQSMFLSLTDFQISISYNLKNLGRVQEIEWDITNGGAWKKVFKDSDIRKMKSNKLLFSNHQFGYEKSNLTNLNEMNNKIIPLAYLKTPFDKIILAAYRHPIYPFYGL